MTPALQSPTFILNSPAPVKLSHPAPPPTSPSSSSPPLLLSVPSWPPQALLDSQFDFSSLHEGQGEASGALDELGSDTVSLHLASPGNAWQHDVSTITDLCSDLPELELVSLLSEGQPNYTLRADSVFGYDNDDWLHTPLLAPEVVLGLTYEQIEETLKYFLLCSERVGQITKTYHDIKAVTQLLEEKERDLELAARIGQSLLKQNRELTARNEVLDEQMDIAKEEIAQLRHELSMRDHLLQSYASTEEIEASESRSPIKRNESGNSLNSLTNLVHYDFLHQKLKGLEDENRLLRCEASDLESETTNYEEQEQELVMVCVEELTTVNKQVVDLSEELARKVEDSYRQQEEISSLLAQIVDLQARCKGLTNENEEVNQHLNASRECQLQLKSELKDLQDKYSQCGDMLREAREDIKNLRNKSLPNSTVQRYSALAAVFPMDSLAAEIEGTFRKGLDSPAPIEYKNHPWRVFETVKVVNRLRSQCNSPALPGSSPVSTRSSRNSTPRTSYYGSDNPSLNLEDRVYSHHSQREDGNDVSGPKRLGQPGTPGGRDLEAALQCLSARQENHSSERPFFDVERELKLRALARHCEEEEGGERDGRDGRGGREGEGSSGFLTPGNDSVGSAASSSTGTNYSNGSSSYGGSSSSRSYLPDRLQIVKPLEGSVTLHQWQQLAKPNLGGILQPRPGVLTKDFRVLETDMQHVYSLNDLEEDEPDLVQLPAVHKCSMVCPSGHNLPLTSHTHTVTTCQVLQPSLLIPSLSSSSLPAVSLSACGNTEHVTTSSGSQQPFDPHPGRPTPTPTSISTTSSLGLLELLQEQGISASTCHHHNHQQQQQPLHPSTFHHTNLTHPMVTGKGIWSMPSKDEEDQMRTTSVFSFNLVEKLQRLGLHQVVAWGTVGTSGGESEVVSPHPPP